MEDILDASNGSALLAYNLYHASTIIVISLTDWLKTGYQQFEFFCIFIQARTKLLHFDVVSHDDRRNDSDCLSLCPGGTSDARSILTRFDYIYEDHMVGRPYHWRSSLSRDHSSTDSLVLKLASPL